MKLFADFFSSSGTPLFWFGYFMLWLTLPLSLALTFAVFIFRKFINVLGGKLVQQKKRKQNKEAPKQEGILDGK